MLGTNERDDDDADNGQEESGTAQQDLESSETSANTSGSRKRRKKATAIHELGDDVAEDARAAGRKYCVMCLPFMKNAGPIFDREYDHDWDPLTRFDSDETVAQGHTQDLFDWVPKALHVHFPKKAFRAQVSHVSSIIVLIYLTHYTKFLVGLNEMRSNAVARARGRCGMSIFGGVAAEDLQTSDLRREQFRQLIGWKRNVMVHGTRRAEGYASMAPILYADHQDGLLLKNAFRGSALIRVSHMLLLPGPLIDIHDLRPLSPFCGDLNPSAPKSLSRPASSWDIYGMKQQLMPTSWHLLVSWCVNILLSILSLMELHP